MLLEELTQRMPAPDAPLEVPSTTDWNECEARLQTQLPEDYKAFIDRYGTGTIDEFLWVYNPVATNTHLRLVEQGQRVLDALRVSAEKFPERFPMSRHPAPGGFLPFGTTDNGDSLFWITGEHPNEWQIAVMGPRAPDVFTFKGGWVEFMLAMLSGVTRCDRFPRDFPSGETVEFSSRAE